MRGRYIVLSVVSPVAILSGVAAIAFTGGFRLNLTPSEPLGIWRIEALYRAAARGDRCSSARR